MNFLHKKISKRVKFALAGLLFRTSSNTNINIKKMAGLKKAPSAETKQSHTELLVILSSNKIALKSQIPSAKLDQHWVNMCYLLIMLNQQRWYNIVQMVFKCFCAYRDVCESQSETYLFNEDYNIVLN